MPYRNLDEFLIRLEQAGELIHHNDATTPPASKAVWIEEESQQFPVVMNIFGTHKRMAWALGLDDLEALNTRLSKLLDLQLPQGIGGMMGRAAELMTLLRSASTSKAPVQEHRLADLLALPRCHITMAQIIISGADGTQKVVAGDAEIIDQQTLRILAPDFDSPETPQPVAIVIGGDPAAMWSAIAPLPNGFDPYLLAGWLRGKPIPMARALTQPLRVPANAEFIIEGTVEPHTTLVQVTAITHREGAIFPVVCMRDDAPEAVWLHKAVERLFMPLLKMVLDEVVDINLPTEYGLHNLALVSINKRHSGQAYKVMHGIWGMGKLALTRVVVVVDADVDVQNVQAVAQRVLETVDFRRDVLLSYGMIPRQDAAPGSKVGIDATRKSGDSSPNMTMRVEIANLENSLADRSRLFGHVLVIQAADDTLIQTVWQHTPSLHVVMVSINLDDENALFRWILSHVDAKNIQINDAGAVAMICN